MKSLTLFLILLITPFITMINLDGYSIEEFKERMKDEGLFDLIVSIKITFGEDVAIISCEELNVNDCGNCKNLVKYYMPDEEYIKGGNCGVSSGKDIGDSSGGDYGGDIHDNPNSSKDFMKQTKEKKIEQKKIEMKEGIKYILEKYLSSEVSELCTDNIIEKVDISKHIKL